MDVDKRKQVRKQILSEYGFTHTLTKDMIKEQIPMALPFGERRELIQVMKDFITQSCDKYGSKSCQRDFYGGIQDMSKVMNFTTVFCFLMTVFVTILYCSFGSEICLTLAITFGTITYHLGMRLFVGLLYNIGMKNRADYTKKWYQIHAWETRLYQFLKVKKWKGKMPAYHPDTFSCKKHTWDEIAQATCQSELVHETNIVLGFVPLAASVRFGAFGVFLITSICSGAFDLLFVMMQRYNRSRIVKMIMRER